MPLQESNNTGDDTSKLIFSLNWFAQTFQAASSYTITSVKLKLFRTGSPGTVTVGIRATTAGAPSGADLTSGTTNGDTLTTDTGGEWREITFSGTALTSGTTYAIVVRAIDSGLNSVSWLGTTTDTEANGAGYSSTTSGDSWDVDLTVLDTMFENYSSGQFKAFFIII